MRNQCGKFHFFLECSGEAEPEVRDLSEAIAIPGAEEQKPAQRS